MSHIGRFIQVVFVLTIAAVGMTVAGSKVNEAEAAPPLGVLAALDFAGELEWYYTSDVGILMVYADDTLHRLDLLAEEGGALDPVALPGLSKAGSVVPIPQTGVVLVAEAPAGAGSAAGSAAGRTHSSYAVDTVSGKILWEAPPLPAVNVTFPYPDDAFVAYRSWDDGGSLVAVDLRTGEVRWRHDERPTIVWTEGRYVRFITGNALKTVDAETGEIAREDTLDIPGNVRLYALHQEGVLILWKNKHLEAVSLPPAPPAAPASPEPLWSFDAEGMMVNLCIKGGGCDIDRVADDRLLVSSAGHFELLRITTGELLWHLKSGGFAATPRLSPEGTHIAYPRSDLIELLDGRTGESRHRIRYPKGKEGMKMSKYAHWLTDDLVVTVFPDKKGNPRRMNAFSASKGELMWSVGLPESADYHLTSGQRASLIGRIALSLVATAVSASNPMSVGGTNYAVVVVPNLDVSYSLSGASAMSRSASGEGTIVKAPYPEARARLETCRERSKVDGPGLARYVVGPEGKHEILEIDRAGGEVSTIARYGAKKVHAIVLFTDHERAMSIENNNRAVRLLAF